MLCPEKPGPEVLTPKVLRVLMHRKIEERYGEVDMSMNLYMTEE
jgi:hypothetical protein